MKITAACLILFISNFSYASANPTLDYNCRAINNVIKDVNVHGNILRSVDSMTAHLDTNLLDAVYSVEGKYISQTQILNLQRGETLKLEKFTDTYVENEAKAGMVLDLKPVSNNNSFSFLYTILNFKSFDVTTAGPIPEGTWNQKVDLTLISEGLTVTKIDFNCKVTVKY
jgi:hypothetical protein